MGPSGSDQSADRCSPSVRFDGPEIDRGAAGDDRREVVRAGVEPVHGKRPIGAGGRSGLGIAGLGHPELDAGSFDGVAVGGEQTALESGLGPEGERDLLAAHRAGQTRPPRGGGLHQQKAHGQVLESDAPIPPDAPGLVDAVGVTVGDDHLGSADRPALPILHLNRGVAPRLQLEDRGDLAPQREVDPRLIGRVAWGDDRDEVVAGARKGEDVEGPGGVGGRCARVIDDHPGSGDGLIGLGVPDHSPQRRRRTQRQQHVSRRRVAPLQVEGGRKLGSRASEDPRLQPVGPEAKGSAVVGGRSGLTIDQQLGAADRGPGGDHPPRDLVTAVDDAVAPHGSGEIRPRRVGARRDGRTTAEGEEADPTPAHEAPGGCEPRGAYCLETRSPRQGERTRSPPPRIGPGFEPADTGGVGRESPPCHATSQRSSPLHVPQPRLPPRRHRPLPHERRRNGGGAQRPGHARGDDRGRSAGGGPLQPDCRPPG